MDWQRCKCVLWYGSNVKIGSRNAENKSKKKRNKHKNVHSHKQTNKQRNEIVTRRSVKRVNIVILPLCMLIFHFVVDLSIACRNKSENVVWTKVWQRNTVKALACRLFLFFINVIAFAQPHKHTHTHEHTLKLNVDVNTHSVRFVCYFMLSATCFNSWTYVCFKPKIYRTLHNKKTGKREVCRISLDETVRQFGKLFANSVIRWSACNDLAMHMLSHSKQFSFSSSKTNKSFHLAAFSTFTHSLSLCLLRDTDCMTCVFA